MTTPDDVLIGLSETAVILGVSRRTLRRMGDRGDLTAVGRTSRGDLRYWRWQIRQLRAERDEAKAAEETREENRKVELREAKRKRDESIVHQYDQGASIRQIAADLGISYGTTHRVVRQQTTMRSRGGHNPSTN